MWRNLWQILKPLLKNKYFVTALAFVIWITIFDENNLIERYKLSRRIREYNKQIEHYSNEIEQNNRKLKELKSNKENLEKFAREEYLMKKDDEVLFVVVDD